MATRVLPSPVTISAILPPCRTMPPINWTSKWRMFKITPARLAAGRERLGQEVVERFARGPPPAEFIGLGPKLIRRQRRHARLQLVDPRDHRPHLADLPLVGAAEKPDQPLRNVFGKRREGVGRFIPKIAQQFHCPTGPAKV